MQSAAPLKELKTHLQTSGLCLCKSRPPVGLMVLAAVLAGMTAATFVLAIIVTIAAGLVPAAVVPASSKGGGRRAAQVNLPAHCRVQRTHSKPHLQTATSAQTHNCSCAALPGLLPHRALQQGKFVWKPQHACLKAVLVECKYRSRMAQQLQLPQCRCAKGGPQPLTAACGTSCWGSHYHQRRRQQTLMWAATPLRPRHAPQLAATSQHQTLPHQILQQGRPLQGQTAQKALLLPSSAKLRAHWSAQALRHPPLASASWQGRPAAWRWLGPGG